MAAGGMEKLKELFGSFANTNDAKSKDYAITLENSDKWMKEAKVLGDKITKSDTAQAFKKYQKENLDYDTYVTYLDDLAKSKGVDATEIKNKLAHTVQDVKPKVADAAQNAAHTASTVASNVSDKAKETYKKL